MTGWRQYAWIVVWLLSGAFATARPSDPRFVAALAVGVAVGVLWQVLARRDVAQRLTALAAAGLVSAGFWAFASATQQESMNADSGPAVYFLGVACAVILTEPVLQRRELGPVTRDLVHAPDEAEGAGTPAHDADRRPGA